MLVSIHKQKIILSIIILWIFSPIVHAQEWSLAQCIDTAQINNKRIQIQKNQIAMGKEKTKELSGNLLPKLNLNGDYKYFTELPYQFMPMSLFGGPPRQYKEVQFGVPHNVNANLQLSMPIYNPQIKGAIQSTKIASELHELQMQKTEEQIYYEIANFYYNAQVLKHQIQFLDSNLVNSQKLLNNLQLLHQQLMATGTDVNKVSLQIDQLQIQKETIANKLEQVMRALKFSMGIAPETKVEIPMDVFYKNKADYNVHTTLDFQLASTQNILLKNDLSNMRKSALPTIALFGTYGINGFGYDKQPNDFLKFHPVSFAGIQFNYTLFDGFVLRRKKAQKQFELKNSELQLQLIAEQNTMEIENAESQRNLSTKSILLNQKQLAQAQTIYKQTILQQKEGVANLNDVLMADNALREVQQHYISAIIEFLKSDLELKKQSGNLSIKN